MKMVIGDERLRFDPAPLRGNSITTLRDDEQATTTDKNCLKSGKGLRSRFKSKLFFMHKYCSYPKIYLLCNISICSQFNCILILPIKGSWDSNCQCIT